MNLLVVADKETQLGVLLRSSFEHCQSITPAQLCRTDLDPYDAFAVLGGTVDKGLGLLAPERKAFDAQLAKGKRVFAEYCKGIGQVSFLSDSNTRFERPVLLNNDGEFGSLSIGTILDEQSNDRLDVYKSLNTTRPILQYYRNPRGFYQVVDTEQLAVNRSHFALWLDEANLMVCSFRLGDFAKAKFAPRHAWTQLLQGIIRWLGGDVETDAIMAMYDAEYQMGTHASQGLFAAADRATNWFINADMLINRDDKPYATKEGLSAHVKPNGTHTLLDEVRDDCTGETAYAFYLKSLLTKNEKDLKIADGLYEMVRDMQITHDCPHRGMVRGSISGWWNVCYQDDTARGFLLPLMWRCLISGDESDLPRITTALDYLVRSTGTDGLRVARTDFYDVNSSTVSATGMHYTVQEDGTKRWHFGGGTCGDVTLEHLATLPGDSPSAHYNGSYMAALLFGYCLTGKSIYLETGKRGLETIMSYYPLTAREHSETQELCRLILPLAMLYQASGAPEHRAWLYQVVGDLQRFRHENGGYIEWDTGYTASCAGVADGESSVLAENGDPVVDLLYSVNWLPIAFITAYHVTGDEYFKQLWQEIADFACSVQISSSNCMIDGVWPRAIDIASKEVYGVPNDIGWGPWSVESGWTVAEISSGIMMGLLAEVFSAKFMKCGTGRGKVVSGPDQAEGVS